MTNTKNTKRALLSSVLALFLCFAMLLGTTYAWFSDSVTSANNIIKSGTLNVEMYYADGSKAVPADDSTEWKNAQGVAIYTANQLWEPGYTDAKHIKISNEGTLALKYQLAIIPTGEVSKLAEVIDVYLYHTDGVLENAAQVATRDDVDETMYVGTLAHVISTGIVQGNLDANTDYTTTIVLKMRENAENEYQNLSIGGDFTIQLIATQYTAEGDSFGTDYDADAWSDVAEPPVADADGAVEVWTAVQLAGVMGNMTGIKTINIMDNIDLAGRTWNSANFWSTGNKTINGNGHTISNMTVNGDGKLGFIGTNSGDITVNDLTFKNASVESTGSFAGVVIGYAYGNITLNNVDVIDSEVSASIANVGIRAGGLLGFVPPDGGSVTLKDCDVSGSTISGYHNVGAMVGTTMTKKAVTVDNCTAKNNTLVHAGSNIGAFAFGAGDSGYTEYVPASGFTAENNTVICRVYTAGQLATAIKSDAFDLITVASGEYGVVDVRAGRKLTIVPQDGATVKFAGIDGQSNNNKSDITIKGITIDNSLATEGWYTGTAQKIKPCVGVWGGDYTFEDCTFFVTGESGAETGVMSWWTTNHGTMTFKGCTFNGGNGSARGMQIYGNYDLNVEECTFNTAKDYSIKYVGDEGCKATLTGNKVYNTVNFVQAGSAPYAGMNYTIEFNNNILADGINNVYVDNDENQTIIIDGKKYVYNAASLAKAVAAGETNINLLAGVYDVYGCGGKTLTINGSRNAIIFVNDIGSYEHTDGGFDGSKVTFNGVTIKTPETRDRAGYARMSGVYNDCAIIGNYSLFGDSTFVGCDFDANVGEHCVWTYGAKNISFVDCDFTYGDRCVNVYTENGGLGYATVSFSGCTFETDNVNSKGAIEINSGSFKQKIEVNIEGCTAPAHGTMVGISGWDSTYGANATVTVDGAVVTPALWTK